MLGSAGAGRQEWCELEELEDLQPYDFVYMAETGGMLLQQHEAEVLRDYLDQGGFVESLDACGTITPL